MSIRTILSSNRVVITIEENNCFWVFHSRSSVSGSFPLNDKRFSNARENQNHDDS